VTADGIAELGEPVRGFTPLHRGGSGPPLLLVHGFTDTWRTWELVLPALERRHEVLAPTLPGHAGGPRARAGFGPADAVDALERVLDEAGLETAHLAGNSLGGYLCLRLAARGRARSVVALAPAGGWIERDPALDEHFVETQRLVRPLAARADELMATDDGRRRATRFTTRRYAHIPAGLLAHQLRGVAAFADVRPMTDAARTEGWPLDAERVTCPVRVVWGSADALLPWPEAAARYREEWLPQADWVVLDDVGHCPQLDVPLETAELIAGFGG
jgi:pimeloyl-ACP methyl ester carboxylesterase